MDLIYVIVKLYEFLKRGKGNYVVAPKVGVENMKVGKSLQSKCLFKLLLQL